MAILIRCLMLLTMLLHSVFGCGWHQIHECGKGCVSVGSACGDHKLPCHHRRQHSTSKCGAHAKVAHKHAVNHKEPENHANPMSPVHQDRHTSGCDHSVCSFVAPPSVAVPFPIVEMACCHSQATENAVPRAGDVTKAAELQAIHASSAPAICAQLQVWRT